jgi:hypothetical protein
MDGGGLAGWRLMVVCALLGLPGGAAVAQQSGAAPPRTGHPTLQSEPGDIWAEVRGWDAEAHRRAGRSLAPATSLGEAAPATPHRPAARPKPGRSQR